MTDEPRRLQLKGKPLVFVFMAATVAAVVIFLCGVMVGRGVQARVQAGAGERLVDPTLSVPRGRPAATRLSHELPPASHETLTYPRRLDASSQPPETLHEPIAPAAAQTAPLLPPAAPDVGTEPAGPGTAITVGAYRERSAAETVARRLAARGYPSYVSVELPGGQPRFLVRVGKYQNRRDAEAVRVRLEREEQFRPVLTP